MAFDPIGLMRIIAGEHRGRRLLAPEGKTTRPITDRVKQSLFDILAPRIPGATVYDCFAGTGSMGLECLSRGAEGAIFFESGRSAVARLRRNVEAMRVEDRSQLIPSDIFRYFDAAAAAALPPADLIFLDPPYRFLIDRPEPLARLAERLATKLNSGAILVFRHDAADRLHLPALERYDQRAYGTMILEFLRVRPSEI